MVIIQTVNGFIVREEIQGHCAPPIEEGYYVFENESALFAHLSKEFKKSDTTTAKS